MSTDELLKLKKELKKYKLLPLPAEEIIEQVKIFEKGIPFVKVNRPCTIGDGIKKLPAEKQNYYLKLYAENIDKKNVIKFVPASGAATRMFKCLLAVLNNSEISNLNQLKSCAEKKDEDCKSALLFFENLERFAFYNDLKEMFSKNNKQIDKKNINEILKYLLQPVGLNYASLPKGSIKFHAYPDGARTAFEEHLVEALNYAASKTGSAKIHFTISENNKKEVKSLINGAIKKYDASNQAIEVSYSCQDPLTDTIAVSLDNKPLADENGKLVLRPAGHGALLKNLNELDADIIFIKNIDNVVPDHLKSETYKYKKILGGYLIDLQNKIFDYLLRLEEENISRQLIDEIVVFIKTALELEIDPSFKTSTLKGKKEYLFKILNRPIRVCGIVKKEKHPGGGPFWVEENKGKFTKQVVETTQIDLNDEHQKNILHSATHFSPVDFICGIKNYKGNKFNLFDFRNPDTGLITKKYKDGKEIKALELPGLWNGGMYYWLTVFVEVPKITFNPVKEVNDLLKKEHQPIGN